ncbi:MAG: hypothetical protein HYT87_01245 [Nitrospirae bacterium]|nr:hypothetical protein [Nitrospirota bacterium]
MRWGDLIVRFPPGEIFESSPDPAQARRNWETLSQSVERGGGDLHVYSDRRPRSEAERGGIPQGIDDKALAYVLGLAWPISRFVLSEPAKVLSAFIPSGAAPVWRDRIDAGLGAIAKKPAAEKMEALQVLRQVLTIEILARELMGQLAQREVEEAITLAADALVEEALRVYRGPGMSEKDFFILAMGKFGAAEMTYESDLDLIFLHNTDNGEQVIRSAQRFIRDISTLGPSGLLYAVDADLRPHGRGGVLVISQEGFLKYHRESTELWEKQALIKARILAKSQISNFKSQISGMVYEKREPSGVFRKVHEMKLLVEKNYAPIGSSFVDLKFGRGGTMDIEFLSQAGQLAFGHEHPELRTRSTRGAIRALGSIGWLSAGEAESLLEAYDELKKIIGRVRLVEGKAGNQISPSKMNYSALVRASTWPDKPKDGDRFLDRLRQFMLSVRKIYDRKMAE